MASRGQETGKAEGSYLTSVAPEIRLRIVRYIESTKDLGTLRTTCKLLAAEVGEIICPTLTLSATIESLNKIRRVSEHEQLSKGVRTLQIDMTYYDVHLSGLSIGYNERIQDELSLAIYEAESTIEFASKMVKLAAKRKCKNREQIAESVEKSTLDRARYQKLGGEDAEENLDIAKEWCKSLKKHLRSWITQGRNAAKGFKPNVEDRETYRQGISAYAAMYEYQQDMLAANLHIDVLRQAAPRLTRMEIVVIGQFPETRESMFKDKNEHWPAFCLDRSPPNPSRPPIFLLDQIVDILKVQRQIKELAADDEGGLSISRIAETMHHQPATGLESLQRLALDLTCYSSEWTYKKVVNTLSKSWPTLFARLPALKYLSIRGPFGEAENTTLPLESLFGDARLPSLVVLGLVQFSLSLDYLKVLFSNHQPTLAEFHGSRLRLLDGTWADALDVVRGCSNLRHFLVEAMYEVNESQIHCHGRDYTWNLSLDARKRVRLFDLEEVEDYILHGGFNPLWEKGVEKVVEDEQQAGEHGTEPA